MNITPGQIYSAITASRKEGFRRWLGASLIGHHCTRFIALKFRCAFNDDFPPRILRVFENGHRAEDRIVDDLEKISGVAVQCRQDRFDLEGADGHSGATIDGIVSCTSGTALLEMKTAKDSDFTKIQKNGVRKEKPQHYAQMQFAMCLAKCVHALYVVENKDTNELHTETVPFDEAEASRLASLAKSIISGYPGAKCSDMPTHWQCKMCPAHTLCHTATFPRAHCLTCRHSAPAQGGAWTCAIHGPVPDDFLPCGCAGHLFRPWAVNMKLLGEGDGWATYQVPGTNGIVQRICNCAAESVPRVDGGTSQAICTSKELECKRADEVTPF